MQYKKILVRTVIIACVVTGTMDLINQKPGDALRSMTVLYFCIPLASLALTPRSLSRLRILGVSGTICLFLLSRFHVYPLIGAGIFVGGILYCIFNHNLLLQRRRKVTARALASIHGSLFCITCAVAGSFSILGRGKQFNVTCDQVHTVVNQHIAPFLTPLSFTAAQISGVQTRVDNFFTKSTDELIQDQVSSKISSQISNNPLISNNPIAQQLLARSQKQLVTVTFQDKEDLDNKICNVVFDQIKEWSTKPGFQLSMLLSLILFFLPLIRLAALVYSVILSVVYTALKRTGFISVVPEQKIVDTWVIGGGSCKTDTKTISAHCFEKEHPTPTSSKGKSPSQIAAGKATSPRISVSEQAGKNINELLSGSLAAAPRAGGGAGAPTKEHIVTPNSPLNIDAIDIPATSKANDTPVDFGSFGGTFGKKPERK